MHPHCNSLQLLHDNVLEAILFATTHEKRATVDATAEILVAGAQQGLVGEKSSEMENGRKKKLSNVLEVLFFLNGVR